MSDFGFVGESYVAESIYQDAQETINWYPETDPRRVDNRGVIALYPTPGLTQLYQFPDLAEVRGLYVITGGFLMLAVCGASLYRVTTGYIVTFIGSLSTTTGPVSMSDNGVEVMIVDGNSRYTYNWNTGYFSTLTTNTFTASMSGFTMTVTAISSGQIGLYQTVTGAGVAAGTQITAFVSGSGGAGTYTISVSQTVGSETMTVADGAFQGGSQVGICDNFFVYANPNTNQWGASNPLSTSSQPLSFSSKDGSPDLLVTLIVDRREVFLLGETTTEVWVDNGSFPFPFLRLPGTSSQHGCAAQYSIARLGESFAWLGKDTRGQSTVYKMEGYVPVRISTFAVEQQINDYGVISDARAFTYNYGGHEFYQLTFPSADVTWVYDAATKMWHKRAWRDNRNVLHRHRANCAVLFSNRVVCGDWQNGKLYHLDTEAYTDDGAAIYRLRRSPHITEDLKRVYYREFQIQFQPGVGLSTGQGVSPQAMLKWSDDGGSTWSNEHWTSLGAQGMYKARAVWRRLGQARDRIFQVVVTDPVDAVIISSNLVLEGADH